MLSSMAARSKQRSAVAEHAWQLFFDFFVSTRGERDRSLERRKLTPNDNRALMSLERAAERRWARWPANGIATRPTRRGLSTDWKGLASRNAGQVRRTAARNWWC